MKGSFKKLWDMLIGGVCVSSPDNAGKRRRYDDVGECQLQDGAGFDKEATEKNNAKEKKAGKYQEELFRL